jgi:hypothetical protein
MTGIGILVTPIFGIPDLDEPIITCRSNAFPIRRPGYGIDEIAMTMIGVEMITTYSIPYSHSMIITG